MHRSPEAMPLSAFGERLCILGPSNSGKSTLADAIARKRGCKVVYLDQLHHQPGTDWIPRPADAFLALHDAALAGEQWVMDGNYTACLPQRLARATGVILLDVATPRSLWRYVRRTLFEEGRIGGLEGVRESLKLGMLHWIVVVTPRHRRRYARIFRELALPKIRLGGAHDIDAAYRAWALERAVAPGRRTRD